MRSIIPLRIWNGGLGIGVGMRIPLRVLYYPGINKLTTGIPPVNQIYLLGCDTFFFVAPFVSCIDIYIYMYITLFGGFVEKVVICDGLPAFVDSKFRFLSCSVFRGQHPMPRKMHFLLIPWWHIFKTNENKHYSKKYMLQPFSSKSQIIYNIWKLLYVEKWHQSQSEWNDS